jgi:benzoate membrane transport protein
MGTLAGHYSYAELAGASLMAGLVMLALSLLGVGARIISWLPLPVVLGMFAGSILGYITRMVRATVEDFLIAGPAVGGYIIGKMINRQSVPPMGLAVAFGAAAIAFAGTGGPAAVPWSLPHLAVPEMTFSVPAFVAVSLPLVVLAMGMGNVQGLGFLIAQGYRVPVNVISILVGIGSVLNPFLGGHPATVARTGVSILAAPEAGPVESRYWASLIAASLTLGIALGAGTIAALVGVLPKSYAVALAGLAILGTFQDALLKAFGGGMRFGALVAFAVAVTPFSFAGITSAFWAIIAGFIVSLLTERGELTAYWKKEEQEGG